MVNPLKQFTELNKRIMGPETIFLIVWTIIVVFMVSYLLFNGRKSLKKFPKLEGAEFEYLENFVSGYSTQSFQTKMGGAKNVLQVRVTKDELWLTTYTLLAWIADQFDLLHKIPIKSLKSVEVNGKNINIEFEHLGSMKKIVIISNRQIELSELLRSKLKNQIRE